MRKRILLSFAFLAIALTALTFFTNPDPTNAEEEKNLAGDPGQATTDTSIKPENVTLIGTNDTLTDIANFIAGIQHFRTNYLQELTRDSSWMKYSAAIEKTWKKLDTVRYRHMEQWSRVQLGPLNQDRYNLFYPFSGPDFLNADLFFPQADTINMFGLEPVGTLPPVEKEWFKDSLHHYVSSLRKSLTNVLQLSFFITKHMFADLRASELNGTTHLLLWFAARRQYGIARVQEVAIGYNGQPAYAADTAYTGSRIKGIEIVCVKNNRTKVIRYFTADLSNYGFKKNPRLEKYLAAQHFGNTLVKSASYLMHAPNFSTVRNLILGKSQNLLQDDTGIPYKYIANREWTITLYGEYETPIQIFAHNYQEDLKKAYDSLETKPLPFGIGYKYRQKESTWILASRQNKLTVKR